MDVCVQYVCKLNPKLFGFSTTPVELPQITQQPANQLNVVPGTEVWFTVAATGEDLAYKWQRDGADLLEEGGVSGTATNTLTITSVQKRDSGTYRCVVSNDAGETSSDPAELTLRECLYLVSNARVKI